jgi:protein-S-isoprenylcysteine O-methyltransferase Ste14
MKLPGMDAVRAHVPQMQSRRGVAAVMLGFLLAFLLPTLFFVIVDRLFPEWMPDGEIVGLAVGFLLLSRFFASREPYRRRFSVQAYPRAFARFAIPGLGIIAGGVAHLAYVPGPPIPDLWWRTVLIALGWLCLLIGSALWLRTVCIFGIDNLAMLYLYFPEQARLVRSSVYDLVRHPIYAAVLWIGGGLALVHANWYALLVALLLPLFFTSWIVLVEEKELRGRFPEYVVYRKRVPAFLPRARDTLRFLKFVAVGG